MGQFATRAFAGVAYRVLALKWYSKGLSTRGARLRAGRFNRAGEAALYLASDPHTALDEFFAQGGLRPAVVLAVAVNVPNLVDITGDLSDWPAHWQNWRCDWEHALSMSTNPDCASWRCGDDILKRRGCGIYFPSTKSSKGENIVLYTEDWPLGSGSYEIIDPQREIVEANPPNFDF
jgi:RES domain-containing protein